MQIWLNVGLHVWLLNRKACCIVALLIQISLVFLPVLPMMVWCL